MSVRDADLDPGVPAKLLQYVPRSGSDIAVEPHHDGPLVPIVS